MPKVEVKPPVPPILFQLGSAIIDARKALPLRMDSWNVLRSEGIDPLRLAKQAKNEDLAVEPLQRIAYVVARKAAAITGHGAGGITEEQLDESLSLHEVTAMALAALSMEGGGELDQPYLERVYGFAERWGWGPGDLEHFTIPELNYLASLIVKQARKEQAATQNARRRR